MSALDCHLPWKNLKRKKTETLFHMCKFFFTKTPNYYLLWVGLPQPVFTSDEEEVWDHEEAADTLVKEDADETNVEEVEPLAKEEELHKNDEGEQVPRVANVFKYFQNLQRRDWRFSVATRHLLPAAPGTSHSP